MKHWYSSHRVPDDDLVERLEAYEDLGDEIFSTHRYYDGEVGNTMWVVITRRPRR